MFEIYFIPNKELFSIEIKLFNLFYISIIILFIFSILFIYLLIIVSLLIKFSDNSFIFIDLLLLINNLVFIWVNIHEYKNEISSSKFFLWLYASISLINYFFL